MRNTGNRQLQTRLTLKKIVSVYIFMSNTKNLYLDHIAAVYSKQPLRVFLKQKSCNEGVETDLQNPR